MSAFHIHIDAVRVSPEFERYITEELHFWRSDFSGAPEGAEAFYPQNHFTLKLATGKEFRSLFDRVRRYADERKKYADERQAMKGYIEGEFIALQKHFEAQPFKEGVEPPFKLRRRSLEPGKFRESEIHITLDKNRSDPRLIGMLTDMGLFSAYIPKSYGVAQVFTVQGTKAQIQQLATMLCDFLDSVGGAVECSIKEERIADKWLSEDGLTLPPVIDSIDRQ